MYTKYCSFFVCVEKMIDCVIGNSRLSCLNAWAKGEPPGERWRERKMHKHRSAAAAADDDGQSSPLYYTVLNIKTNKIVILYTTLGDVIKKKLLVPPTINLHLYIREKLHFILQHVYIYIYHFLFPHKGFTTHIERIIIITYNTYTF